MEFENHVSLVSNLKQDKNGNEVKVLIESSYSAKVAQEKVVENDRENNAPIISNMESNPKAKKVKKSKQLGTRAQKKKNISCKKENGVEKPKKTKGTKSKIKVKSNGNNDTNCTDSAKIPKTKLQRFCNVVQVKTTRKGKLEFFTDCIPIFLMCGSENMFILNDAGDDKVAFLLCKENGQIIAILTDFLLPGNYLISKIFSDNFNSCPSEFAKLYPENRLSLQVKTLSPYLSSTTDPVNGHHFIMIGHITREPVHHIVEENANLETVVEEFEKENWESCFEASVESIASECDHLFYCMIMSVLKNVNAQLGTRKRKFQMRIQFVDELMLKRKKKKYGKNLKMQEVVEITGDNEEDDLAELDDDSVGSNEDVEKISDCVCTSVSTWVTRT